MILLYTFLYFVIGTIISGISQRYEDIGNDEIALIILFWPFFLIACFFTKIYNLSKGTK